MNKPRLFLDTNVILDLLGKRIPFYESIAYIATMAESKELILSVSSLSIVTTHYILSKYDGAHHALEKIRRFKILVKVIDLTEDIIDRAMESHFRDFEDAVQYHSAVVSKSNYIITRNGKDFKLKDIQILTAQEFINTI